MVSQARGLASLQPFRHRPFALLWTAGLISIVGSWMQTVAVGALVISDTGNAIWAVLVAAGAFLPIGLLGPVGGALADRLPRLEAGCSRSATSSRRPPPRSSPCSWPRATTTRPRWWRWSRCRGSASALIGPFQQAILPDLVPESEFLAAVSLNSAQFNLGRIVWPALAGATVAAFGYAAAFTANAVSFLAIVVALAFVRLAPPAGRSAGLITALRSGFAAARREPSCWAAIVTIAVVAFFASPRSSPSSR